MFLNVLLLLEHEDTVPSTQIKKISTDEQQIHRRNGGPMARMKIQPQEEMSMQGFLKQFLQRGTISETFSKKIDSFGKRVDDMKYLSFEFHPSTDT
jgi:hypothetical protein